MSSKKIIKFILQMIGPLIFFYIIFQIDYLALLEVTRIVVIPLLLLSAVLMILEIIIKSWRWKAILAALGIRIAKLKSVELFWLGAFVGVITPGKVGELIKVYFLNNKGYDIFRSFFSVIIDRIIDIAFLLFLGILIFFFYLQAIGIYLSLFALIFLLLIITVLILINKESRINKLFSCFIENIIPFDLNNYNRFTFNKFWYGIRSLKKENVVYFIVYLFIGWLFYFLSRYAIALSIGLELSFINVVVISVSVAIVSALPISIAGLGTREAVIIYFFNMFGLSLETALVFSLLIFAVDLAVISLGLVPYVKESALISRAKSLEL